MIIFEFLINMFYTEIHGSTHKYKHHPVLKMSDWKFSLPGIKVKKSQVIRTVLEFLSKVLTTQLGKILGRWETEFYFGKVMKRESLCWEISYWKQNHFPYICLIHSIQVMPEDYDYNQELARAAFADMLHDSERNQLYRYWLAAFNFSVSLKVLNS